LRANAQTLVFSDLPSDLQLVLRNYAGPITQSRPTSSSTLDYKSIFSSYSDFQEITNETDLILEYVRNWFNIRLGTYPFDSTFGTKIHTILHTKDAAYQNQLLSNELGTLVRLIQNEFSTTVQVVSSTINPVSFTDHVEYNLELHLKVLGRLVTLNITG